MSTKPLKISIVGDASKFNKAMGGVGKKMDGLRTGSVAKLATAIGSVFAIRGIVNFGKDIVGGASDIEESISKVNNVMGAYADQVKEDSENVSKSMGISKADYLEWAGTAGAALSSTSLTEKERFDLVDSRLQHTTDLASFHNAEMGDVSTAWDSALRGSYEPVQKYLPFINDEYIKSYGIRNGLIDENTKKLDTEKRAIVLNAIAYDEEINPAVNDFAETSEGLANQQKILAAQWDNMKAKLGEKLLPIVVKFATWLNDELIPAVERTSEKFMEWWNSPGVTEFRDKVGDMISKVVGWIRDEFIPWLGRTYDKIKAWWTDNEPTITKIKDGIVDAFTAVWGAIETVVGWIQDFVDEWNKADDEISPEVEAMKTLWEEWKETLTVAWDLVKTAWTELKDAFVDGFADIKTAWDSDGEGTFSKLDEVFTGLTGIMTNLLKVVQGVMLGIIAVMTGDSEKAWESLELIWEGGSGTVNETSRTWAAVETTIHEGLTAGIIQIAKTGWADMKTESMTGVSRVNVEVRKLPGKLNSALEFANKTLIPRGKEFMQGVWDGYTERYEDFKTDLESLGTWIFDAVGDLGNILWDTGKDIIGGLWGGMEKKWEDVKGWLSSLGPQIPRWKGPMEVDRTILIDSGVAIMSGLQKGLDKGWTDVQTQLSNYTTALPSTVSTGTSNVWNGSNGGITINASTSANPHDIAREVSWAMRSRGG